MPLGWNEIRSRAVAFSRDWAGESREDAEAKTFWDDFFTVFGLRRRQVASFEEPVKNIRGSYGFIDLFWKGVLLAEHKSRNKNLGKAHAQAMDYIQDLQREGRGEEVPRYVIISDFARIALHDLEENQSHELPLAELHENVHLFGFIPGYKQHRIEAEDPINIKAVQIMGDLHDALEAGGYSGHDLERMLVRVLFCLFAEDTGIFERNAFTLFLENHTRDDGSDLGIHLARFFSVLNTPQENRQGNLPEELAELPYVNGDLFAENLRFAEFNRDMRNRFIACTRFDWSRISPAVFGSLFQAVMESRERRRIGGHYTSERDILKVIGPLFLDELREQFDKAKRSRASLLRLHERIASMRLLDPACGCGNFLVVAYREMRRLELDLLRELHRDDQRLLNVRTLSRVDVDQMFGIEIQEWPVRIAEVALWLMDHQMNLRLSEAFGQSYVRLPLKKSPRIEQANALRIDWAKVLPVAICTHIFGNPPFVGAKYQDKEQREDLDIVADGVQNAGLLDYVTGWYFKAAMYIKDTTIPVAFVSTNSITQGEQVGVLWSELFDRHGVVIHFGHRTFPWESEARGKAHVHVVIIGFGVAEPKQKLLYDYESNGTDATVLRVSNISPYLVEGPNVAIKNRSKPLCKVPEIGIGNKPIDDGNYLFTAEEKKEFLRQEPAAAKFFRLWYGSVEFINRSPRWCLWVGDCPPERLRAMPSVMRRVEAVRKFRLKSKSDPTRKLAATPTRFHVENMPSGNFLLIPKVSSERRRFIPMGFMKPDVIVSDLVFILPKASLFQFGVLSSTMHMAWVRHVAGRLESRYRYSAKLVYNNYPWPAAPTDQQRLAVESAAQDVLDARSQYPQACLADLYNPVSMPAPLAKAHGKLDRAVDRCYRSQKFESERKRVEYLFDRYQQLVQPLLPTQKRRRG